MEEYIKALEVGVQRAADFAITFSPDKCQFGVEEIEFYGLKFTKDGLKQNSEKISAVKKKWLTKIKRSCDKFPLHMTGYL